METQGARDVYIAIGLAQILWTMAHRSTGFLLAPFDRSSFSLYHATILLEESSIQSPSATSFVEQYPSRVVENEVVGKPADQIGLQE